MSAEATTFVVDVSPAMERDGHLSKVIAYLEYTLLDKCKRGRKTDWISCYLANCRYSKNSQSISNVYEAQEFVAPVTSTETLKLLRYLQFYGEETSGPRPSDDGGESADIESVESMVQCLLVSSLDMKEKFKTRKMLRQTVVFTADVDGLDLNEDEIDVLKEEFNSRLILIDCRKKTTTDSKDSDIEDSRWGTLVKAIPGSMVFDINDLLLEIALPKPAVVKPVRIFAGELRLGAEVTAIVPSSDCKGISPADDERCLCIKVEGYPATKRVSTLNRKLVFKDEQNGSKQCEPVKSVIEYEVHDDKADKRFTVAQQSIAKAYRYGSDYVVLPSTLDEQRYYRTSPGIDIRGFLDRTRLPRYMLNSESRFILPDTRSGSTADMATFSALVDTMLEHDKVCIVRYVAKCDSEVEMCMLCPLIMRDEHDEKVRTLILNRLPFAEDERVASFPRLTNRTTTSGKKIEDNQEAENSRIDALISNYIDSLDMDSPVKQDTDLASHYYLPLGQATKDSTLPLPGGEEENILLRGSNPFRVPAIHLHRQKQVLLEWIHQKLVIGSDELQMPEMPDVLREKIQPHYNDRRDEAGMAELVKLLNLKQTEKKFIAADEQYDLQDEAAENIPSLESILALGER
ncbi:hypothetical protein HG536_0A03750 [Torulaspora globosa]|uniref:ATP-dependent DNA helicase II subunit 2 n=1 Tax=Torulaspora globosa TaxID=48254 RepID=A0A7G3ZAM1_9SACH|nr:uncharacterized protein HG536_0A03750 [Torulaspora globosa]QLL30557.1 hypothetical protein HG536_0A03750 [Torulaspora globosa]